MRELLYNEILPEMFRRVGQEFTKDFCRREDWFLEHTWTTAEQEEFRKWLVKLLVKKGKMSPYGAQHEASWFLLAHGWKTQDA